MYWFDGKEQFYYGANDIDRKSNSRTITFATMIDTKCLSLLLRPTTLSLPVTTSYMGEL